MARPVSIFAFNSNLGLKEPTSGTEPGVKKLPAWLYKPGFMNRFIQQKKFLGATTLGKKILHYYTMPDEINFLFDSLKKSTLIISWASPYVVLFSFLRVGKRRLRRDLIKLCDYFLRRRQLGALTNFQFFEDFLLLVTGWNDRFFHMY